MFARRKAPHDRAPRLNSDGDARGARVTPLLGVAQPGRAAGLEPAGQRFKSSHLDQLNPPSSNGRTPHFECGNRGSNPCGGTKPSWRNWIARPASNRKVASSNLAEGANFRSSHASNGRRPGGLIKAWIDGVAVEDQARKQLDNMASMPFIHKHVAIMPDCHWGMGATVGSVIPTKGAIIPAAVGVDIGCGMMAVRTSLTASDLPDNLHGRPHRDRAAHSARSHRQRRRER
jgi:hypothetical protein